MAEKPVTFRLTDEEILKLDNLKKESRTEAFRFCLSLLEKFPALARENAELQKAVFELTNQLDDLKSSSAVRRESSSEPVFAPDTPEDEPPSEDSGSDEATTAHASPPDFSPPEPSSDFSKYDRLYPDLSPDLKPVLYSIIDLFRVDDKWINLIPVTNINWGDCGPIFDKLLRDGIAELVVSQGQNCVLNPLLTLRNKKALEKR